MTKPTTGTPPPVQPPMRADARRNRKRLVAAAAAAFTEHGAEASLDDIARRAGVGSGTLYRHFPTRQALLEAVYLDQVEALCAHAYELLATAPPGDALATWLRAVVDYATMKRGLSELMHSLDKESARFLWCRDALRAAGGALLARAQQAGAVRSDVTIVDLLRLIMAISKATEPAPGGADRLLAVVLDGLRNQQPAAS